ncbi:hypothetical protein ACJX0J_012468, partial [Zea mays]
ISPVASNIWVAHRFADKMDLQLNGQWISISVAPGLILLNPLLGHAISYFYYIMPFKLGSHMMHRGVVGVVLAKNNPDKVIGLSNMMILSNIILPKVNFKDRQAPLKVTRKAVEETIAHMMTCGHVING